jgi:glycosyltransferase involved in cell wall biosynthesis
MDNPFVSIVVPTRNEEEALERLLRSLSKQRYKKFETIVVDGHSKDGTVEVAKAYGARVIEEYGKYRSAANARNIGIAKSKGTLIGVVDSDIEVDKDFISTTVDVYNKNRDNFFGTRYYNKICDDTFLARIRGAFIRGSELNVTPLPVFTAAKYRKAIGEWDPSLGFAEDRIYINTIDNYLKKNKRLRVFLVNNTVKLHVTHTIDELIAQQRWYGRTVPFYLMKSKNLREWLVLAKTGYTLIPLGAFSQGLFLLSIPFWLLTLFHTLKALSKGEWYGIFIPALDILMSVGFVAGLCESIFSRTRRGRD